MPLYGPLPAVILSKHINHDSTAPVSTMSFLGVQATPWLCFPLFPQASHQARQGPANRPDFRQALRSGTRSPPKWIEVCTLRGTGRIAAGWVHRVVGPRGPNTRTRTGARKEPLKFDFVSGPGRSRWANNKQLKEREFEEQNRLWRREADHHVENSETLEPSVGAKLHSLMRTATRPVARLFLHCIRIR